MNHFLLIIDAVLLMIYCEKIRYNLKNNESIWTNLFWICVICYCVYSNCCQIYLKNLS